MKEGYFITGFPGFISEQLIKFWLSESSEKKIYVLVLPAMMKKANETIEKLMREGMNTSTIHVIEGDITKKDLGLPLPTKEHLQNKIHYVWHLAAVYDLAVEKSLAYKVNVTGTYHVNEWVKGLPNLKRYVYFSTAYVAGRREGAIRADELIRPYQFRNYYEETKYEAEVLVQKCKKEIPITIFRPSIVKGDKKGATTKFDGPYYLMNIMDRLRKYGSIPYIGKSSAELNVVPVDYVIAAADWLSRLDNSAGKTYHLTDPQAYPAREIFRFMMMAQIGKKPTYTVPYSLVNKLLRVPYIRKYLGVERQALDYFQYMGRFVQDETEKDLAGSTISCPDYLDTLGAMVTYYEQHKNNKNLHPPVN
ncbi:SDR family oxidoreductase [Jeotgalibacillus sp. ET6]|uniref:SDR family oxidoreductase n=1 Tax=Jeotgalibacillus sp. ET6 TaxID=3037260 RepID=UPI002418442E|nr:SDR family oxidoreductase [Jeotgalibacillus sp. ET6]MDG5473071.1 SDR family oxidoreductase [Jeotgalibacillus sp. ET6]